jgi:hypothetical protein
MISARCSSRALLLVAGHLRTSKICTDKPVFPCWLFRSTDSYNFVPAVAHLADSKHDVGVLVARGGGGGPRGRRAPPTIRFPGRQPSCPSSFSPLHSLRRLQPGPAGALCCPPPGPVAPGIFSLSGLPASGPSSTSRLFSGGPVGGDAAIPCPPAKPFALLAKIALLRVHKAK